MGTKLMSKEEFKEQFMKDNAKRKAEMENANKENQ